MSSEVQPGYKKTELGLIPVDWDIKKLKHISPSQSVGLVINPSSYFDEAGTIPMLVGSTVGENSISWEKADKITEASNLKILSSRLNSGDLVTVRVGEPGTTAVVPPELDGCNCASMMIIRKHSAFNSLWLCYAMNSKLGKLQVEGVQYGTAQKQFNISDAINFIYPVPSISEQRAIAAALSDMDALISGLDQLIAKKRDIKQATMQKLLTGKKRLPGFSGEWEMKTVSELGKIVTGGTPRTDIKQFWGEGYPWITPTDISSCRDLFESDRSLTQKGLGTIRELPENTVLVTCIASIGKNAILRSIGGCNQQINAVIPNASSDANFLYYLFDKSSQYLMANAGTTATSIISKTVFSELTFKVPPYCEQSAIAAILSDMDAELSTLESRRNKAKQLKQGMMQELLTGRIRLL